MAVTVTYKGNTIATVADNQSVILQTKGTWCSGDITVQDTFVDLEAGFLNDTLTTIYNNTASIVGNNAFNGYTTLTSVEFTMVSTVGQYAFSGCTNLQTAHFRNAQTFSMGAFFGCSKLTSLSFSKAATINQNAFANCSKLASIYFMGSSVATLIASNCFNNTPMTSSGYLGYFGSIYVPASLVNTYKTKSFWSLLSARITGI